MALSKSVSSILLLLIVLRDKDAHSTEAAAWRQKAV